MVLTLAHPDLNDLDFDVFHDKSDFPTLVVVEGSDDGINHAVGVAGDWVFESNCEKALKLSKATMDFCVSTEERKSQCVGAHWAMRLIPRPLSFRLMISTNTNLKNAFPLCTSFCHFFFG